VWTEATYFVSNQNTGIDNTTACNNFILGGIEPISPPASTAR